MKRTLVIGGPGAGKTERSIRVVEEALARGVPAERIAFVSFTRSAVEVARNRACERFNLAPDALPYFRTLHSLCFRELGLRRSEVLAEEGLTELSELTGELVTGQLDTEGPALARRSADTLLTIDHYARATMKTLREAWTDHGGDLDWHRLNRFSRAYHLYKEDYGVLDFTDMLVRFVETGLPVNVDVAVVDEAQDLTLRQWRVVECAFAQVQELWVFGDDLQSIHRWAGAAEDHFLKLPFAREILPLSHRLSRSVFELSEQVASRVSNRFPKDWAPSAKAGKVTWFLRPEEVDLSQGSWLLMARTRSQLTELTAEARNQGVVFATKGQLSVDAEHVRAIQAHEALRAGKAIGGGAARAVLKATDRPARSLIEEAEYTAAELGLTEPLLIWHDALVGIPIEEREYYLACLRRGESLTKAPRVKVETIHGAKGMEADHVLLLTDLTYRTQRAYELDPDSEHRVFYVGVTRASETLNLIAPQTAYGFPI